MLTIGAPTEASGTPAAMDQGISGAATTAVEHGPHRLFPGLVAKQGTAQQLHRLNLLEKPGQVSHRSGG